MIRRTRVAWMGRSILAQSSRRYSGEAIKADMALVKELRATTSFGIVDCRNALVQAENDLSGARVLLRDWAREKAKKKLERTATEGLITISLDGAGERAAVVEVNSETDFVPRLQLFQQLCETVGQYALSKATPSGEAEVLALDVGDVLEARVVNPFDKTGASVEPVRDAILDVIGQVGENVQLRRIALLYNPGGILATFVHGAEEAEDHQGTLTGVVGVKPNEPGVHLTEAQRDFLRGRLAALARHVATSPRTVPQFYAGLESKQFYGDSFFASEECPKAKVETFVADLAREAGLPSLGVNLWHRWRIGEGLKKKEANFAKEVEEQVQKASKK